MRISQQRASSRPALITLPRIAATVKDGIAEYVGRIFAEVKRRPLYLLGERVGFDARTVDHPRGDALMPAAPMATPIATKPRALTRFVTGDVMRWA